MKTIQGKNRIFLISVFLGVLLVAFIVGRQRITVDSDITSALPHEDPVVASARLILEHHGALDNVFIDISLPEHLADKDTLVQVAEMIGKRINESGLARVVAWGEATKDIPQLLSVILHNLPLMFSPEELAGPVSEQIKPDVIRAHLRAEYRKLFELGSMGSQQALSQDPLGLSGIILGRLEKANPFPGAKMYKGYLFSQDYRHLLIMAEPTAASRDTSFGRNLNTIIETVDKELREDTAHDLKIAYAGAFRATLDNEQIIRKDTFRAIVIVTIGLLILAVFCFQRPWRGVLTLVPAVGGLMLATLAYSFYKNSMFAVSMGFGGALISIAVDHALAYALLIDSSPVRNNREISREVWRVASFTVYTTVAALISLTLTDIPLFEEVGVFAALGVGFAAILVHVFFPLVFQGTNQKRRRTLLPLGALSDRIIRSANKNVAIIAIITVVILAFFIRFEFNADISTLNTVSAETAADEEAVFGLWGGALYNTYALARGETLDELWLNAERLTDFLKNDAGTAEAANDIILTSILPGPESRLKNLRAWKSFWTEEKRRTLQNALNEAAGEFGFRADAFDPFLKSLSNPDPPGIQIPPGLLRLFGISNDRQGNGLVLVTGIRQGDNYNAERFFSRAFSAGFPVYDAKYFSWHLGETFKSTFFKMFLILSITSTALLIFLFMDWRLVLAALLPLLFSLTATLGTLGILGLQMSLPSLMIAPLVFGLGMDYGLYLVRSRQRFGSFFDPNTSAFLQTILLGGISTLIGACTLILSEHVVLRTVGLNAFLGIAYAMIGAFTILPPFLGIVFKEKGSAQADIKGPFHRVNQLYRNLEPHPRYFARFKMNLDPMFPRLADFITPQGLVLDIGCGYGVPSAWLSSRFPDLRFVCIDPDPERIRVVKRVLGEKAKASQLSAPSLPEGIGTVDTVLFLDVAHYLTDADLANFLVRLKEILAADGQMVMRVTLPINGRMRWQRWIEILKAKWAGSPVFYRPEHDIKAMLERAGFKLILVEPTSPGREETWFIAR